MDPKTKVNTKRTLILSDYQASPSCIATKATKSKIDPDPVELTYNKLGHLELQAGQMIQEYQVTGKLLGEGTFGRVWEVLNIQKNKKFALKLERRSEDAPQSVKKNLLSTEILNLRRIKKLDSSGLKSLCAKLYKDIVFNGHSCLVFDVLGQSVFDFMNETNEGRPYLIEDLKLIASQLFNAVKFLHSKGIVHTDLKPENILFVHRDFYETKSHGDKNFRRIRNRNIRLIDFGGAHFGKVGKIFPPNLQIQTALYRAIECLLGLEWSAQVDIWSIGCILYELYKGKALFYYGEKDTDYEHNSLEHLAMINKILGEIPEEMFVGGQTHLRTQIISEQFTNQKFQLYYSNKCKNLCDHIDREDLREDNVQQLFDLMQQCFVFNYTERITPSQAIQHQFFQYLPSLESYVKSEVKEEESEEDKKVNELEDLMQNITLDKIDKESIDGKSIFSRDDEKVVATCFTEGQRIRSAIERNSRANKYFRLIPTPIIPKMNKSLIPRQAHKRGDSIEPRSTLISEAITVLRNHDDKNFNQESFIKYKVGDLVMVECEPYPHWPAIVQIYPAAKPAKWKYEFTCLDTAESQHRQFYLQYLGPLISRAWTDQTKILCHYTGWFDFCTQIGHKLLDACESDDKRMMKQIVDDCIPSKEESDIEGMTIADVWLVSMAEADEARTMTNEQRIHAFTHEYVDEYTNKRI